MTARVDRRSTRAGSLTYDAEDHATAFGTSLTAGYIGGGLRAWKQGSTGGKTYFHYDGAAPVCELDGTGAVTATNTFGSGLLSRHTSTGSTFYTFDERGNVAQRLSNTGAVQSTDSYDAYGASASTPSDPFGFGAQFGYYTDSETGLQLCQHRYYDSSAGRFLTRDPAGYGGGLNLYAYCANNPVSSADPSGFNPQSDGGDGLNDARDANPFNLFNPVDAYGMSNDAWTRAGNGSGTVPAALATTALAGLSIYGIGKGLVMGAAGLAAAGARSLAALAEYTAPEAENAIAEASSTQLARYDPEFVAKQILGGREPVTPGGRPTSAHAADRIANGGPGRPPGTVEDIDTILDNGTKVEYDPSGNTIQVKAGGLPGKPYVVVDAQTQRVVTVMMPKPL